MVSKEEMEAILAPIGIPEMALLAVESLHCIGFLTIIKFPAYNEEVRREKMYVVLDPKWLAGLLCTVVSVKNEFIKNGILTYNELSVLWKKFPSTLHEPLIQLLSNLDVLLKLDDQRLLIPSLFPDFRPDSIVMSYNGGDVIRRSYMLDPGVLMPVGVMGKVISTAHRIGNIRTAWRTGCVGLKDGILFCVCRDMVGESLTLHLIVSAPAAATYSHDDDFFTNSQSSLSLTSLSSSSSSFSSSSSLLSPPSQPTFQSLLLFFRRLQDVIRNIYTEFYHLNFSEIIPLDDDCSDWCNMQAAGQAFLKKSQTVRSLKGNLPRLDVICPDLLLEGSTIVIPRSNLEILETISITDQGAIHKAMYTISVDSRKEVAIKQFKLDVSKDESIHPLAAFAAIHHEVYLMDSLKFPNIVSLLGVCVEEQPPWIVMEYCKGGDLFGQLTDPSGLLSALAEFFLFFEKGYALTDKIPIWDLLYPYINVIFKKLGDIIDLGAKSKVPKLAMLLGYLKEEVKNGLRSAAEHWELRTESTLAKFENFKQKVYSFFIFQENLLKIIP